MKLSRNLSKIEYKGKCNSICGLWNFSVLINAKTFVLWEYKEDSQGRDALRDIWQDFRILSQENHQVWFLAERAARGSICWFVDANGTLNIFKLSQLPLWYVSDLDELGSLRIGPNEASFGAKKSNLHGSKGKQRWERWGRWAAASSREGNILKKHVGPAGLAVNYFLLVTSFVVVGRSWDGSRSVKVCKTSSRVYTESGTMFFFVFSFFFFKFFSSSWFSQMES